MKANSSCALCAKTAKSLSDLEQKLAQALTRPGGPLDVWTTS